MQKKLINIYTYKTDEYFVRIRDSINCTKS